MIFFVSFCDTICVTNRDTSWRCRFFRVSFCTISAFSLYGEYKVWGEAVTKGGRRFMAAWRQEEEDAARHRQEKREATRLGKLQSYAEA